MSESAKVLTVAFVATALATLWLLWLGTPVFPLDDPYIVQHSIHSLFLGHEDRFVDSRPLDGVTSPAFLLPTLLLSTLLPIGWANALVNAAAAALYVVGVFRFAISAGVATVWAALVAILGVTAALSLFQLLNGLETGLAMAAVIWTLLWFRDPLPHRSWKCAILGVMPFIRPELALLSLLIIARMCWTATALTSARPVVLRGIAWAVVGALPVMVFLISNGASPIPATMTAKTYFFAEGCRPFLRRILMTLACSGGFITATGLAAAGFAGLALSKWRGVAIIFVTGMFAAYVTSLPSAPEQNHGRYLHILVPFALVGWVAMMSSPVKRIRRLSMALFVGAFCFSAFRLDSVWRLYNQELDVYGRVEAVALSDWIASHIPGDATIAVHDAGYLSLHGTNPLVDIVGLKSLASIEAHRRYTYQACARDPRALDEIARRSHARYFVAFDLWDRVFHLTSALRSIGWTVTRVDTERGDTQYKVYAIAPPAVNASN